MRKVLGFVALAALATSFGCKAATKLVGTWEAEISQMGQTGHIVQVIEPGGAYSSDMTMATPVGEIKVHSSGTWESASEESITLTTKDITFSGMPKELEGMAKTQIEAAKAKPQVLTVKWNGNDEFTTSNPQGTGSVVFKRKKS